MEIFKKNKKKLFDLRVLIYRYRFAISFLLLAIFSVALGAGYSVMIKKLIERPGEVLAAGSGLSNITWDNLTTGASGTAVGTTTWSISGIVLQSGVNNITLTVLDNAGNSSSTQLTVNYAAAGFTCGSPLVDARDWKSYATVQIGTQCWMKQGLNVGTQLDSPQNQDGYSGTTCGAIDKYCYGNSVNNCDSNNNPNYPDGGLYQWNQAMCGSAVEGVQGICPTGWHIPTDAEICTMTKTVDPTITCVNGVWDGTDGGTKLKPGGSSGWEGNLAGELAGGLFYNRTSYNNIWSSTPNFSGYAWMRNLYSGYTTVDREYMITSRGYSIRCINNDIFDYSLGVGGNVNGWGWSAGTGWINFSASNTIAMAPSARRFASAIENSVERAASTVSRIAKFFRLNFNHNLATKKQTVGLAKYVSSFVDSLKLSIKIALAAGPDFGVSIDTAGQFSGYAWSDAVGWIYFGPDDDLTAQGYGNIASAGAPSDPKIWAKWSQVVDQPDSVTGWANILALGADGWIKMSDASVGTWVGKGVSIQSSGDFTGWAWNSGAGGTAGIGWISFNAKTCDIEGFGPNGFLDTACGGDNVSTPMPSFLVTTTLGTGPNTAPTLTSLEAPHWSISQARTGIALRALLSWNYFDNEGDPEDYYQVIVKKASDDSIIYDSTKTASSGMAVLQVEINKAKAPLFDYGTAYKWWVTVWDTKGASTTAQYDTLSAQDTPAEVDDGNPLTFTTFTHEFPKAYFDWTPKKPSAGQNVVFDGRISIPDTGLNLSYFWDFINIIPASATGATTTATVDKSGTSTIITLTITDDGTPNYSNSTTTNFTGKLKLPSWTEQKP